MNYVLLLGAEPPTSEFPYLFFYRLSSRLLPHNACILLVAIIIIGVVKLCKTCWRQGQYRNFLQGLHLKHSKANYTKLELWEKYDRTTSIIIHYNYACIQQKLQVTTLIGDISIAVHGENGETSISELRDNHNYHWYADDIEATPDDSVQLYGAVVAADESLVHNDEYVAFRDDNYNKVDKIIH